MKKVLAVFMAILMIFSCMSVAVYAAAGDETTTEIDLSGTPTEEKTTRDIMNDDGLVIPINFKQLKMSVIFKLLEKVVKFILKIFVGDDWGDTDESIADVVSSVADDISQAIEEGSQFIDDNT